MKLSAFVQAGLLGFFLRPAFAENPQCGLGAWCISTQHVGFYSVSDAAGYGVVLSAPHDLVCPDVRYRLLAADARAPLDSPPLGAGDVAVLRVGAGFAEGDHALLLVTEGPCTAHAVGVHPVRLSKPWPDHGWRTPLPRIEAGFVGPPLDAAKMPAMVAVGPSHRFGGA